MKDKQKELVYKWEEDFLYPIDKKLVPFDQIKSIVDYVWNNEKLLHPPRVELLHKNNKHCGTGCRLVLKFPRYGAYTWVILHEIAHALSSDVDDQTNMHGALFMGIYLRLLRTYMQLDLTETARKRNIVFNLNAVPFCA